MGNLIKTIVSSAELYGNLETQIAQQELFDNRMYFHAIKNVFSQGRTLGLLDVSAESVVDRLNGLKLPRRILIHCEKSAREEIAARLCALDYEVDDALDLLVGEKCIIKQRTDEILASPLCLDLRAVVLTAETPSYAVRNVQKLQCRCDVTPIPGWILRGLDGSSRTTTLVDREDRVVGGIVTQRLQMNETSNDWMGFGLCLEPEWRGNGVGRWLNAAALNAVASGAGLVQEIVSPGQGASRTINEACGLSKCTRSCFIFAKQNTNEG